MEAQMQSTGLQIFIIATTTDTTKIPPILLSRFTNEIVLKVSLFIAVHNVMSYLHRLQPNQNDQA